MQPTNNFRLVLRGDALIGALEVLQQKWCDGYGKCEWRDIEVVEE